MTAVRFLIERLTALTSERFAPTVVEHGYLMPSEEYSGVFGDYGNVYGLAGAPAGFPALLRPDNLVTNVGRLLQAQDPGPRIAVGGILRDAPGKTPPLFRDRFIWPAVQLTHRVGDTEAQQGLDFYSRVVETLVTELALPVVTVRTPALADYGRVTHLAVSVLPDGRPTVLATLYLLADRLRTALGDQLQILDIGFTGKLIALCAMLHHDARGLALPSMLAPVQVGITVADSGDALAPWLARLTHRGIRWSLSRPCGGEKARSRAEARWHRLGVPLVIGVDREPGAVIRATRLPLRREPLLGLPEPDRILADLAAHDDRLTRATMRLFTTALRDGGFLRDACETCAKSLPVFGVLVPERRRPCESCGAADGTALFISEQGRFY
ncbi:hypothetical protein ACWGJ6_07090 [Streptomyces canus]|uniref:hypothetical protein n=1 Tax=Streptomyces sp. SAI-144 TaxID=2940544 RepID=UPI00247351D2|nr:hypothetical protein [Streptomyces sp. SAI-144]